MGLDSAIDGAFTMKPRKPPPKKPPSKRTVPKKPGVPVPILPPLPLY